MTRVSSFKLSLFMLVLSLRPITEGQFVPVVPVAPFAPRPLCNYQMALANQACAYLPYIQAPPQAPRAPNTPPPPSSDEDDTPEPEHRHRRRHRHEHDEDPDRYHDEDPDHDHDDDRDHDDDGHDNENEHNHGHKNHHQHHHKHHHHHRDTPVEQQCCKWLSQVDDQCVCELLVRLPPFLARPLHRGILAIRQTTICAAFWLKKDISRRFMGDLESGGRDHSAKDRCYASPETRVLVEINAIKNRTICIVQAYLCFTKSMAEFGTLVCRGIFDMIHLMT